MKVFLLAMISFLGVFLTAPQAFSQELHPDVAGQIKAFERALQKNKLGRFRIKLNVDLVKRYLGLPTSGVKNRIIAESITEFYKRLSVDMMDALEDEGMRGQYILAVHSTGMTLCMSLADLNYLLDSIEKLHAIYPSLGMLPFIEEIKIAP